MKNKIKLQLTLVLFFLAGNIIEGFTQAPQSFNYQAVVRDSFGQLLVNKPVNIRISIIQGNEENIPVYSEIHNTTTNTYGIVNLKIGSMDVSQQFSSIDWSLGNYFIKIELKPTESANFAWAGTTPLQSVPYALFAQTGIQGPPGEPGTSSWTDGTGNVSTLRKVGIGIENSNAQLLVQGTDSIPIDTALFEVKNKAGETVFGVYDEGVHVFINESSVKGAKGGFTVGGRKSKKGINPNIFTVTPDSVAIILQKLVKKGAKGGFVVGGRSAKGEVDNFMNISPENYFIGHQAGMNNTSGSINLFFGYQTGLTNTTGSRNIFQGYQAGYLNSTGNDNVFLGDQAGYSNTSGYANVFLGNRSGYSTQEGYSNTFLGNHAGFSNNTGYLNILIGDSAGYNNITGSRNVFIGQKAGEHNSSGDYNVFLGQESGGSNTTGRFNVFIGRYAGYKNLFGQLNTFLGINSGFSNTTGNENVSLGGESGKSNSTGSFNLNLGTGAGYRNGSGSRNIMIGYDAGYFLNSGGGNIYIGANSGGTDTSASNRLYIENSNAGKSSALIYGEFDNDYLRLNANVDIRNGISLAGNEALTYASNVFKWGAGATFNFFPQPVTIGGVNPVNPAPYALYVNGDIFTTGTYSNSDERLKTNIRDIGTVLPAVNKIRTIYFDWRGNEFPEKKFSDGTELGFIAQEIELQFPELVKTDPQGFKTMDYSKMTVILLKALKEQQAILESFEKALLKQQGEINELRSGKNQSNKE